MTNEKLAAKLVTKKKLLDKSKLKKTIKNVLCKSDKDFWPELSEAQSLDLAEMLSKHKIQIPEFKKLPWSVLKTIPKEKRPKQKRNFLIPGFKFGMSESVAVMNSGNCSGVIIDAGFSPRIGVSHVIETAVEQKLPVVCMASLKTLTNECFGFPASCVVLNKDDRNKNVREKIYMFWKKLSVQMDTVKPDIESIDTELGEINSNKDDSKEKYKKFEYLTKMPNGRAFLPPNTVEKKEVSEDFTGQHFIKLSKPDPNDAKKKPVYKGMIVKKFCNNSKRKN